MTSKTQRRQQTSHLVEEVREMERQILEDKRNSNLIVKLLGFPKKYPTKVKLLVAVVRALGRIFGTLAQRGDAAVRVSVLGGAAKASSSRAGHGSGDTGYVGAGGGDGGGVKKRKADDGSAQVAGPDALDAYRSWLDEKLALFVKMLLLFLHHQLLPVQAAALHTLMDLVAIECQRSSVLRFHDGLFSHVLAWLLVHQDLSDTIVQEFCEKFACMYGDVRFYTLGHIKLVLESDLRDVCVELLSPSSQGELDLAVAQTIRNAFRILLHIKCDHDLRDVLVVSTGSAKDGGGDEEDEDEDMDAGGRKSRKRGRRSASSSGGVPKQSLSAHKKRLSETWLSLLGNKLPMDVYKMVLAHMHEDIMPCVSSPPLLSDFLTDSYNVGGVVSLLSLNALFFLITKHNLDYPSFFEKLYRLLKPQIFHVKYKSRFFKLLDTFLRSSHLPSYLVAAFAKRMVRLALTAPPNGCAFVLALVFNLMRRHPQCKSLIHRPIAALQKLPGTSGSASMRVAQAQYNGGASASSSFPPSSSASSSSVPTPASSAASSAAATQEEELDCPGVDPFIEDEDDPTKCRASESSLWEIKTLCNHYCPTVSRIAQVFGSENAPKKDFDMAVYGEYTLEGLFSKELEWRANQIMPLNFDKPTTIFAPTDTISANFRE